LTAGKKSLNFVVIFPLETPVLLRVGCFLTFTKLC